ncbi:Phosphate-selective porin O and P [Planctomycetes bacterium Poly30]|uniref:Phosphate-selective porin O and P n=1 Tax=Saltatorellus ferox TaxID=2528018 RepID=A0A518F020_9BACT|nr:Phosphate-selective porin O and P [Planctomycetes bacterium Poly30]
MKKLVFGAAALSLTGLAFANDSDWQALDQDIQALSASVQGLEGTGMNIGGRIRTFYNNSGDVTGGTNAQGQANDLGGFTVNNARLYAYGTTAQDIGYRLEIDFAGQGLLDAYLDIPVGGEITARVGQFRAHVLRESLIDSGNLFFADRSAHASLFAGRSQGLAVMGNFDAFDWAVTIQNGGDSVGDELFFAVRAGLDILGEGTDLIEGAYGASEEMEASAGIAYFSDEATDDADGIAVEASLATSQFSAQAVILNLGEGVSTSNADGNESYAAGGPFAGGLAALTGFADNTPFAIGGTFMLTEASSDYGAWEIGARFQDLDDDNSTRIIDIGANYYADGHNLKYIINWTSFDSDAGASLDGDLIRVGVNARF